MVDTLRVNLTDCEIKRSCPLTVQPGLVDYATGKTFNESDLFIDNSGRIVKGFKAYLNDDKFNLTINPSITTELNDYNQNKLKIKKFRRIDEGLQPDIWDYNSEADQVTGIFLQTSLPRLLNETNLKTLSFDDQKTALKVLEQKLKTYGIKTNIDNSILSRVDTFTNLKTDLPFYSYANLFSILEMSRMKSIGYGNESFLWKNGNQELMIYDKILEMKSKRPELKFSPGKNIMRIENRLLKKRKVLPFIYSTELKTVDDLYKNYDELKYFHSYEIKNRIFKYSTDEFNGLIADNIKTRLINSKKLFGKRWFKEYCYFYGLSELALNVDLELIAEVIEINDGSDTDVKRRIKKSRIKKQIEQAKIYFGSGGAFEKLQQKSMSDLYNELKTKFFKEAA